MIENKSIWKISFILVFLTLIACSSTKVQKNENINYVINDNSEKVELNKFLFDKLKEYRSVDSVKSSEIAQDYYLRGLTEVSNENFVNAIYNFEHALKFEKSPTIYISLAEAYLAINDTYSGFESAINAYLMDHQNKRAFELLYSIFVYAGDYQAAEVVIRDLYNSFPTNENLLSIADFYFYYKKEKSIEYYEKYLGRINNEDVELRYISALFSTGQQNSALNKLLESIKTNPTIEKYNLFSFFCIQNEYYDKLDTLINQLENQSKVGNKDFYNNLINSLVYVKPNINSHQDKINNYLNKFKAVESGNATVELNATYLAVAIKDTALIEYFLPRILKNVDTMKTYPLICSEIYSSIGRKDLELEVLLKYKNVFPEVDEYSMMIGYCYYRSKQYIEAMKYFIEYKDKNPDQAERFTPIGDTYDKLKDYQKAEEYYLKALSIDSLNAGANNNYAYFLSQFPLRLKEAEKFSRISLEIEPEIAAYIDTFGWILFLQGNNEEALKTIENACLKDNTNWEIYEHLGDIYLKMGEKMKAAENWEKALELDNNNAIIIDKLKKIK